MKLTQTGKHKVKFYIKTLELKRKEILDAGKDTADETKLPTIEDIIADIETFEENEEYLNNWGVTDNYDNDFPLWLERGEDYYD